MSSDIYTIGHSTHDLQHFIGLLKLHEIKAVADVRQSPYSGIVPHFNRETLKNILVEQQIQYVFLGNLLGARPTDPVCYRDGKVDHACLLYSEPTADKCHRRLVAEYLKKYLGDQLLIKHL